MSELKACPCCNKIAKLHGTEPNSLGARIGCDNLSCELEMIMWYGTSDRNEIVNKLIKRWNTRHDPSKERLRVALDHIENICIGDYGKYNKIYPIVSEALKDEGE